MRFFIVKAIVVSVVTAMLCNAAHAQNSTLSKFDPSLYLKNAIPPISGHILISRTDYSGPFTTVMDLRFSNPDGHLIYSIQGNRSVSFIGDTIAIKMDVSKLTMDTGNGPKSVSTNPVFSYSYIVRMDGKILSRSFTPGDELAAEKGEDAAKFLKMLEDAYVGADAIKKDIGSMVWGDVAQDGNLGALVLGGSWASKSQLCGADLGKVHYFAKGSLDGVILGRASISTLDDRQGCSIDLEAYKIIDSRNGQVLYNSIKLDGKERGGEIAVDSHDQFESWQEPTPLGSQAIPQANASEGVQHASGIVEPVRIRTPAPIYPQMAIHKHLEGVVTVEFTVGEDGHVSDVSVARSSGSDVLDRVAVNDVKKWLFKPALRNGVPVSRTMRDPITFSLHRH